MNRAWSCILLALVLTLPAIGDDEPAPDYTAEDYEALLARVKEGDTAVSFVALRFAFAETSSYSPMGTASRDALRAMFGALEEEDFETALERAEAILEACYVHADAHMVASIAHASLGNEERAEHHGTVARGLIGSICSGTDGRTSDAPCRAITVDEEYLYLRAARLEHSGQALTECRYGPCDAMDVRDPTTGEEFTIYFDISTKMRKMEELFRGGK